MTTPNPTPEKQNSPEAPDEETVNPDATGFFNRVRRELNSTEDEPLHPSEAAEIVIMDEPEGLNKEGE
jgi:hypothetical protein